MNIKQAEAATGISRQNIRFYEKEKLLAPAREAGNSYRRYTESDIRTLKLIKTLRMLDMPLEDIRAVLAGTLPLAEAAARQSERLAAEQIRLADAIRACGMLRDTGESADALDVDACLADMEASAIKGGYFMQWVEDYKKVAKAEHEKVFTFVPDEDITTARGFTDALFAYANANGLNLVVTKESMYPEFTLDGTEYTAIRDYHAVGGGGFSAPVATVYCEMVHPEACEAGDVPEPRRVWLRRLHKALPWLAVLLFAVLLLGPDRLALFFTSPEWFVVGLGIAVMFGTSFILFGRYHYNENGKTGRR